MSNERMTALGRGPIFQPVLASLPYTQTCTYNSDNIITLQHMLTLQIFHIFFQIQNKTKKSRYWPMGVRGRDGRGRGDGEREREGGGEGEGGNKQNRACSVQINMGSLTITDDRRVLIMLTVVIGGVGAVNQTVLGAVAIHVVHYNGSRAHSVRRIV